MSQSSKSNLHYLNNAGASLLSESTKSAIFRHLELEQSLGAYVAAERRNNEMQAFYERAARLLNAPSDTCVFYNDSASRGWNVILNALAICKNDHIVTFSSEFGTNLVTLYNLAERVGAKLTIIECDKNGGFCWEELEQSVTDDTALLCISHAAAHGSIVNPVVEIGTHLKRKPKCTYIVDGCQAVGQLPVDVQTIGCDAYVCTGRKWLRGPRGTGFTYVREGSPFRSNHFDLSAADLVIDADNRVTGVALVKSARQFELWERSVALMLGLSEAIQESVEALKAGLLEVANRHAKRLRLEVSQNHRLSLIGEIESPSCTVGFICNEQSMENSVKGAFEARNISYSSMGDWDCPLHFPRSGVTTIFRLSPHYYTSQESVDAAIDAIKSSK